MAGSITSSPALHRARGVIKLAVALTADASGVVSALEVPDVFGKIVGFGFKPGAGGYGPALVLADDISGKTLVSWNAGVAVQFGNTTTGDTTGGTAEDLWTTGAAHGLVDNDVIVFLSITGGGNGVLINTPYYVDKNTAGGATTFQLLDDVKGTGTLVNVGDADVTASTWYKVGSPTLKFFRPTEVATTNAGAAITAADTAPNVNRDIFVGGKLTIAATFMGNLGTCDVYVLVDESDLGDPALTV